MDDETTTVDVLPTKSDDEDGEEAAAGEVDGSGAAGTSPGQGGSMSSQTGVVTGTSNATSSSDPTFVGISSGSEEDAPALHRTTSTKQKIKKKARTLSSSDYTDSRYSDLVDPTATLNPVLAGYFCRIVSLLVLTHPQSTAEYISKREEAFFQAFVANFSCRSITELYVGILLERGLMFVRVVG